MTQLPIPNHFQADRVGEIWRVPYQDRAIAAHLWANQHQLVPTTQGHTQVRLLLIDVQNTFCQPDFELFVGGQSGRGAIEDNVRLCEFIYHNLGEIDQIIATLDTHHLHQIFHPIFWIDEHGQHPAPGVTTISPADLRSGRWRVILASAMSHRSSSKLMRYIMFNS